VQDRTRPKRSRPATRANETNASHAGDRRRSGELLIELARRGRTAAEIGAALKVPAARVQSLIDGLRHDGTLPQASSGDRVEGDFLALLETTELTPARAARQAGMSPADVKPLVERLRGEDRLSTELASRVARPTRKERRPAVKRERGERTNARHAAAGAEAATTAQPNSPARRGPAPKLDGAATRGAYQRIKMQGERTEDVATSLGVGLRTLFKYFAAYGLSVNKTDPRICKRALKEAQAANDRERVSWRTYLELRRSHPAWPTPKIIVRELKAEDWADAQRLARVRYR
jgi:plasmid maintenance system antidote protein VapI